MSAGGLAVNVKGPEMVSRSWVPMATRVLLLQIKQEDRNAILIKYVQDHLKGCPNYSSRQQASVIFSLRLMVLL